MLTKKNIDKMLEMPDDRLGSMIRLTLAAAGADTSNLKLDETAIRRIRAVLTEVTDADLERAATLMERYRTGG
ncbi:MAG: hypothetical protein II953_06320 [Clostridia bacterium]|nr:hypothetical protein [Clostridia bacterium]MBQ5354413.1 hypothetical protein [Clostridia bacterium]